MTIILSKANVIHITQDFTGDFMQDSTHNLITIQEKKIKIAQDSQEDIDSIYNTQKRQKLITKRQNFQLALPYVLVLAEYETGKLSKFHTKRT